MSPKMKFVKEDVGFPVYALEWQDDSTLVASGGGGAGKFGVKNKIIVGKVEEPEEGEEDRNIKLKILSEAVLSSEEDAPMTLAVTRKGTIVTGINQSKSFITERKQNKHLRIFEISPSTSKITFQSQKQVIAPSIPVNEDHYQRQTVFNRHADPNLLGIASTSGDLSILSFPNLDQIYTTKEDDEFYSLDFSPADNDTIVYITSKKLIITPFRDPKRRKQQNKKKSKEIDIAASQPASFTAESPKSYRCARYLTSTKVLAALNDRKAKKAYFEVYILNLERGWRRGPSRQLPARIKGVTGMDVNSARRMVAISTSDMGINIFHMDSFATLLTVERVADFAVTQVSFNPSGGYLGCSSVANSISLIKVDEKVGEVGLLQLAMQTRMVAIAVVFVILAILLYLRR